MARDSISVMRGRKPDERGASLILALIFMVVVSLIVLALAAWTSNGLRSSISFTQAQSMVATANGVANLALQETRSTFLSSTLNASPGAPCWTNGATPSYQNLNSWQMNAYCSTSWNPQSDTSTRRVTVEVCLNTVSSANCAVSPFLLVIATFDDYPVTGGVNSCSPVTAPVAGMVCGTKMSIRSWVYGANPPTITSVASSVTPTCTTRFVQISGSNFISGSTNVYFVTPTVTITLPPETIWSSAYPSTSVNVTDPNDLTACEPSTAVGATSVYVSTHIGQSLQATLP